MKAAVLVAPNQPLEIEQLSISKPGPHEVLIRTAACGLCHSDLHFIEGTYPHALPAVPGHEAAGIVEAVGSEVRTVKVGDAVVTCLSAFCGHCEFCVTGRMALCLGADTRRAQGSESRLSRADGSPVAQMLNLSAFAEMMLIHEHACTRIDPDMPLDRASIIGCAVTTGASTIFNACKVTPGETVAVVGCGGVGLATINAAKIAGASKIIAADPIPEKRELAMKLGATHTVDALADDAAAQILELTKDRRILDAVHALVGDTTWQELAEAYTSDMPETLTTGIAGYFRQVADLADTWAKSIGDGVVSDSELAEIRLQVFRGIQGLLGMVNRAAYVNQITRGADRG